TRSHPVPEDAHDARLHFSADSKTLVAAVGVRDKVRLLAWSLARPGPPKEAALIDGPLGEAAALDPTGTRLALAAERVMIGITDVRSGRALRRWQAAGPAATVMAWSPDGRTLASGDGRRDRTGTVTVWDSENGRALAVLRGHRLP